MNLGSLTFIPISQAVELVAQPVRNYAMKNNLNAEIFVSSIDPTLADTTAFCEHYGIGLDLSANCIILEAKRADKIWYTACIILATTRADVNGIVKKELDAAKISFAAMDKATTLTQMEYGGITPIGLPQDWPILIDEKVMLQKQVIVGSGIRGSKILVATETLKNLVNAKVMNLVKSS